MFCETVFILTLNWIVWESFNLNDYAQTFLVDIYLEKKRMKYILRFFRGLLREVSCPWCSICGWRSVILF